MAIITAVSIVTTVIVWLTFRSAAPIAARIGADRPPTS